MKKEYEVLNVKCGGCAGTVTKKLKGKFPDVEVDLDHNPRIVRASVDNKEDEEFLLDTLRGLGYPLTTDDMNVVAQKYAYARSYVACLHGKIDAKTKK